MEKFSMVNSISFGAGTRRGGGVHQGVGTKGTGSTGYRGVGSSPGESGRNGGTGA